MFKSDFEKRSACFLILCIVLLMLLASCEKKASLSGGAHDVAVKIYTAAGNGKELYEENIIPDEAYTLGISPEYFSETIEEAKLFHLSEISGGKSMAVIVARDELMAGELFEKMYDGYDWVPCDPAENAAFMVFGRYIVLAKDMEDMTQTICRAFSDVAGGKITTRISRNPM